MLEHWLSTRRGKRVHIVVPKKGEKERLVELAEKNASLVLQKDSERIVRQEKKTKVNGKDCVFTCYDERGNCYCAIEKAYRAGKVDFCKPVSCALYPIRVGDYGSYKAVNYHRWNVCKAAVLWGKKENLPVYKFLKEPLVRKFGEEWYAELEIAAEELKERGLI